MLRRTEHIAAQQHSMVSKGQKPLKTAFSIAEISERLVKTMCCNNIFDDNNCWWIIIVIAIILLLFSSCCND